MRRLAVASVSIMLLGALPACSDDAAEDASESASEKDFCEAMEEFATATNFEDSKSAARNLADVGTPEDTPDRARGGFEVLVNAFQEADDEDELEKRGKSLSPDEEAQTEEFVTYTASTCDLGDVAPPPTADRPSNGLPSEVPSDLLDELPSEFPSDLLSDLPSDLPSN